MNASPGGDPSASELPIDALLPEVAAAQRRSAPLLLMAPPGSGKTTRVPPALLPVFAHLALVLALGIYVPPYLADWYRAAAHLIGGG